MKSTNSPNVSCFSFLSIFAFSASALAPLSTLSLLSLLSPLPAFSGLSSFAGAWDFKLKKTSFCYRQFRLQKKSS